MIHLRIKLALFSFLAVFAVSVFMTSCEQENLEDTIGNIELNEQQMPIGERIINEYIGQKQQSLDVEVRQKGSQAYMDFLFKVSMGHYPDLTGKGSDYVKSPEELNAVIDFIMKERAPLYKNYPLDGDQNDKEVGEIKEDHSRNHLKAGGYDRIKAKDYALHWAKRRNGNYPDFSGFGAGGDCTNFVSQAIEAGGIRTEGSGDGCKHEVNNAEWYVHRGGGGWDCWGAENDWEWSTPWAVPYPFRVYHRDKGNAQELGWTTSAATAAAHLDIGDVVQIQKDRGNGWVTGHAMIVTEVLHNDLRVTYHSVDTENQKLSDIILGGRRFQLVRFR